MKAKKNVLGGMATPLLPAVALGLVFGLVLAGCGGSRALVGTWVLTEGQVGIPERLELSKDGTGVMDILGYTGVDFTWTAEKGRLSGEALGKKLAYDYKIAGSTLTLTGEDGESAKYKKEK